MRIPSQNHFQIQNRSNILSRGPVDPTPTIQLKTVQNCHEDRHAICSPGTELNFLLKILSSLVYYEMARRSPLHVFLLQYQGMGDFVVLGLDGLTHIFGL
jgi:hypothetical protein